MSTRGLKITFRGAAFLLALVLSLPVWASGYSSVRREWTRSKQWFEPRNMNAEMIWHATYFSPEFRKAYEQEIIQRKYMGPVEAARFVAEQEKKQATTNTFFVGLYTRKEYKEFSMGAESFWQAVLVAENGQEAVPISIEMVPISPLEKILFPYLSRWSAAYRVVFPRIDTGRKFGLILRSVLGETHLQWK